MALYKRANGYRPFLYNITHDVCDFFANRKRYPILKAFFDLFLHNSNLNHTCPYYVSWIWYFYLIIISKQNNILFKHFQDAIIVKDLVLREENFKFLPLPEGDYQFKLSVAAYNDLKATVQVFLTRRDDIINGVPKRKKNVNTNSS